MKRQILSTKVVLLLGTPRCEHDLVRLSLAPPRRGDDLPNMSEVCMDPHASPWPLPSCDKRYFDLIQLPSNLKGAAAGSTRNMILSYMHMQ